MNRKLLTLTIGALVILSIGASFWLGRQDAGTPRPDKPQLVNLSQPAPSEIRQSSAKTASTSTSSPLPQATKPTKQSGFGVIKDEAVLQFKDRASYEQAIRELTEAGISMRGSISSLGMLRVQLPPGGIRQLNDVLGDLIVDRSQNIRVALPQPIEDPSGGQVLPFGADWLAMIGTPDDNENWGQGVRIAVIDTGVTSHAALQGARINRISMIDESVGNGHGNAVTSIIVGNGEPGQPRGLAPAAEILAYQAMGQESGDSFTIAKAIVDAVDHGANIINLSLGGWGDAPVVRNAVQYADEAGVVIVAAVGNDRQDQITYPAAYDTVIGVTSIDAGNHWAEYPNVGLEGAWPDIAAPGVALPAAYADGQNIAFSGTSAAAPVVSAAIAATMSETGATARQSAEIVLGQTSDRGEPGADPYLGSGVLDITRIMRANERGVYDLAVSDHYVDSAMANAEGLPVRIGIQNRGTETVQTPVLTILIGTRSNSAQIPLPPLAPGQVTEYEALIPAEYFMTSTPAAIGAFIQTNEAEDVNPDNNVIATSYGVMEDENGEITFVESRNE